MASSPEQPQPKEAKKRRSWKVFERVHVSVRPVAASDEKSRNASRASRVAQEDNAIRIGRARPRSQPPPEVRSNDVEGNPAAPSRDSRVVPEEVQSRYVKVGKRYHFSNGDLAWIDRGRTLSTKLENSQIVRDFISVAQARGADSIAVRGTNTFKKEAWQQAKLAGLTVRGYRPTELERAQLARLVGRELDLDVNGNPPSAQGSLPSERSPTRPGPAEEATRADARQAAQTPDRVEKGRLLEHGVANLQFDRRAELSYYVKIESPEGRRTLWGGRELQRAVEQSLSRAKAGDDVVVRQLGSKPVTVTRAVRDENGQVADETRVESHLNRWSVERADFLKERAHAAGIVRDPSIDAKTAVARRPELAGTYTELHAAKLIAQDIYAHPADQQRFIARVREAIAGEIERGEPLSAPRVRNRAPQTPERAQERVLS